ncbi:protein mono-ADP-ribosyltransferase PARP12 isoform X3 [Cebidichthys violaceus]|uniref:protein mono-ADP-ribosyltransferase PARP12 isoform X3 n=1 Tax=Cebidichthys violaceus TaxID=271503 RepID=UPI0035CC1DBD
MAHGEEMGYWQKTPVNGKHYEWQLSNGHQWLPIDNDHVIETHYCQPGAKGITVDFTNRQVFIDFDKLQTLTADLGVQRLSFLRQGQTEDVGWYFRDDQLWREYGSQSSNTLSSSISSANVERQFALSPRGTFSFTVGSTGYSLDFSTMTQTNCNTGLRRKVRRRPKFTSNTGSFYSTSVSSSQLTDGGYKWEFMGDEGRWTEYKAHVCSFDSAAVEGQYQLNPQGQLHFKTKRHSYTLDFSIRARCHDGNFKMSVDCGKIIPKEAAFPVRTSSSSTNRTRRAP